MALTELVQSIIGFIRNGYPEGVPQRDYFPLLALLRRRLTGEEVVTVVEQLTSDGQDVIGEADVRAAVERITSEPPSEADVERVRAHLRASGWDLA